MKKPALKVDITLDFPVPVQGADGKEALRTSVTIHRPRTVHVKRLAVLIGADFLKVLLGDNQADKLENVDARKLVLDLVDGLFTASALDELTAIIASMCQETPAFIDQLDPLDLKKLGEGFLDFFPALRSLGSSNSAPTPPPASDGDPTI